MFIYFSVGRGSLVVGQVSSSIVSTIGRGHVHTIPLKAIKKQAKERWGPFHYE